MYTRTGKWLLVLPALVVTGLVLFGCTRPDPEVTYFTGGPTSTDTATSAPTTEAPSDPSQTSPDEARNAYLNYVDVRNAVQTDYYRDWETKYLPLTTGEEMDLVYANAGLRAEQGYHRLGPTVVKTRPEVLEYDDTDPLGNYRAEMKACVDTSRVELVAEGHDVVRANPDGNFYFEIVMERTVDYDSDGYVILDPYEQGWWRVASERGISEQPC